MFDEFVKNNFTCPAYKGLAVSRRIFFDKISLKPLAKNAVNHPEFFLPGMQKHKNKLLQESL
jgi:hypothetical protein